MRFKLGIALAGTLVAALPALASSPDPLLGTWVLNVAKSTYKGTPAPKSSTVVYSAAGLGIHVVAQTVTADGRNLTTEYTGTFDGKDFPVTGNPDYDMQSMKRVSDHKFTFIRKQGGKVVLMGSITVAADGLSRTAVTDGVNAAGTKIHTVAVYDKKTAP